MAAATSSNQCTSGASGSGLGPGAIANLPVGSFPAAAALYRAGSYLSRGGNAAGLFPVINPSSAPNPASGTRPSRGPQAETAADAAALGTPPVTGAQIAGLAALAIAIALGSARFVRRRLAPEQPHKD